jgi:hypothetical protein
MSSEPNLEDTLLAGNRICAKPNCSQNIQISIARTTGLNGDRGSDAELMAAFEWPRRVLNGMSDPEGTRHMPASIKFIPVLICNLILTYRFCL